MSAPAVGTRLRCAKCGTEIIVVKAPTGPVSCCDQEMGSRGADEEKTGAQ
ncbi:MAG TPA: hypothetical protein VIB48_05620 [Acidimicrobiia bacterium]